MRLINSVNYPSIWPMETCIEIKNMSFFYVNDDAPADMAELTLEDITVLFTDFTLSFPQGVTSVLGENGIGKSTLLLLAAGRLLPVNGSVTILGTNTSEFSRAHEAPEVEGERNKLVSFVYQNMEFETPLPLGEVLSTVYENGFHGPESSGLMDELIRVFDLTDELNRPTQSLSKGAMQRAVIAMALLYGSKIIMMDEPVFAMEEPRKEAVMKYIQDYSHRTGTPIIFTAHQLHLCQEYSDTMIILRKNPDDGQLPYIMGPTKMVCTKENLEAAYRVPMETLQQKEHLYREMLLKKGFPGKV